MKITKANNLWKLISAKNSEICIKVMKIKPMLFSKYQNLPLNLNVSLFHVLISMKGKTFSCYRKTFDNTSFFYVYLQATFKSWKIKKLETKQIDSYAFNVFISYVDCKKHEGQRLVWVRYV